MNNSLGCATLERVFETKAIRLLDAFSIPRLRNTEHTIGSIAWPRDKEPAMHVVIVVRICRASVVAMNSAVLQSRIAILALLNPIDTRLIVS